MTKLPALAVALALLFSSDWNHAHARPAQVPRVNHAQALLPDGRVLVAGGEDVDRLFALGSGAARALLRSTALFDPATGRWSGAGALARPRTNHATIALPDGRALVLGGGFGRFRLETAVEEWNPDQRRWSVVGRLRAGRLDFTATLLRDGRVLVVGGARDDVGADAPGANVLSSVEIWDPVRRRSIAAAPLPVPLTRHTATMLADGRVLVTGGTGWWGGVPPEHDASSARAFLWNPGTDHWTETGSMSGARVGHAATLLPDGRILVVGNRVSESETACADDDAACQARPIRGDFAEIFDPRTGRFTRTGATRFPRLGDHQVATLRDGRVAVFGVLGVDCVPGVPQVVELWSPASGAWEDFGDASVVGQTGFRVTGLRDGRLLLTGARMVETRRGARARASVELWDPARATARRPAREPDLPRAILE